MGDEEILKNIDFARKGLESGQYLYSAEICKYILLKEPGSAEAQRILQIAAKAIYDARGFFGKVCAWLSSVVALFSAYALRRTKRMRSLQRALWRYPRNKVALILLAQCAMEDGHLETMLFVYEELHLLFPKDMRFALALGGAYLNFKDYKNALNLGEKLLKEDPSNTEAMSLVETASLAMVSGVKRN